MHIKISGSMWTVLVIRLQDYIVEIEHLMHASSHSPTLQMSRYQAEQQLLFRGTGEKLGSITGDVYTNKQPDELSTFTGLSYRLANFALHADS